MDYVITGGGGDTCTPLNMEKRIRLMGHLIELEDTAILDLGCGAGEYVVALSHYSANVRGIETDQEKVKQFQQKHQNQEHMVDIGSAETLPYPADSFDIVIANEVLEHIPDQNLALNEIHRVLKPNGRFLLFCPNRLYPFESHGMEKKDGTISSPWIPVIPYLPIWTLRYLGFKPWARNYEPWEINRLLRKHNFSIISKTYISQTFENISGRQPRMLSVIRPMLRRLFSILEKIPVIRMFICVSQVVVSVTADHHWRPNE